MIKQVIRLTKPMVFLPHFTEEEYDSTKVLVRPICLSICAADQRYFNGNRPQEVLKHKLPMALFHEATGVVLHDPTATYSTGQNVILLPYHDDTIKNYDNYDHRAFFRSSNADGFSQEVLYLPPTEILPFTGDHQQYIFTEILSVCCHAFRRLKEKNELKAGDSIGIWGDGSMGYFMAFTIHILAPHLKIQVYGKHDNKLSMFSFVDKVINIHDIRCSETVDYAFECVGGQASQSAIEQIIEQVKPCGTIILMGVSEVPPVINTRRILEKGLYILGSSRSQRQDFEMALEILNKSKPDQFDKIVKNVFEFKNYSNLSNIFREEKAFDFKTIIKICL